jgi:hypothetical protein
MQVVGLCEDELFIVIVMIWFAIFGCSAENHKFSFQNYLRVPNLWFCRPPLTKDRIDGSESGYSLELRTGWRLQDMAGHRGIGRWNDDRMV